MINWDKMFEDATATSGPGRPSLMVQNLNPSSSQGSRNIYSDDEDQILAAAKKHGYKILSKNKHSVHFIKHEP